MPQALPLTTAISQGFTRRRKNRTLSAQFGDGYSQDMPDGLNALVDEVSINYENLTLTERNTLWTMLDAVGGWDIVTYTPPGDVAKKWKITADGVTETVTGAAYYNLSFSMRQVF